MRLVHPATGWRIILDISCQYVCGIAATSPRLRRVKVSDGTHFITGMLTGAVEAMVGSGALKLYSLIDVKLGHVKTLPGSGKERK